MKKRNVLAATFASAILLGSASVGTVAHAAALAPQDTEGTIEFTAPTESSAAVKPVLPTDPTQINTSADDNVFTGQQGPLTLDVAPNLPFATHEIGAATTFKTTNAAPYFQVSDRRGAAASTGWTLTGTISDFKNADDNVLTGAKLTMAGGTPVAANVAATETDAAILGVGTEPALSASAVLESGAAATTIMTGSAETVGTWLGVYNKDNISLEVPATVQSVGSYTATLTWNLTAGPAA